MSYLLLARSWHLTRSAVAAISPSFWRSQAAHCSSSAGKSAAMATPVSRGQLEGFRKEFDSCPKNRVAQNAVTKSGVRDACISRSVLQASNTAFSCRLPDGKPITNQKSSGRCWIFAALNAMRQPMAKEYNVEKIELSQTYVYFWDKVERANYGLETAISLIESGEDDLDGRMLHFLLQSPLDDGGQWDMISALIAKHGVVPKSCMPESHSSSASRPFTMLITRKMRQFVRDLQQLYAKEKSVEALRTAKEEMVATIYRMCCIALGTPPSSVTWEYTDKNKLYHCHADLTPVQFYETLVKPVFDLDTKVCLVHDPRPSNPYYETYTVQYLGSVVGGRPIRYINVPMDDMKETIRKSLLASEPVWFGCDVNKDFDLATGYQDLSLFDFELAFGTDVKAMDKTDMIRYGESIPSHAMLITGFNVQTPAGQTVDEANVAGPINKWCVENSWGDDKSDKGFLTATDDWFSMFVFMAVVDQTHLSGEALAGKDKPVRTLPPWDPMGTLA